MNTPEKSNAAPGQESGADNWRNGKIYHVGTGDGRDFQPEQITVIAIKTVNFGNLRAFATVQIDRVLIHDCRVIEQPGKSPWAALPQTQKGDKYFPIVELSDRALADRVKAAILAAYAAVGKERDLPI